MRSKHLMNLAVSTASLLLTLLALEIGLRLYGYNPLRNWQSGSEYVLRASAYPDLKYELAPGTSGSFSETYRLLPTMATGTASADSAFRFAASQAFQERMAFR